MKVPVMTDKMRQKQEEIRKTIRQMSAVECAWLAGVIDGEGLIGLYDYGKQGRRVMVQVTNTNEEFVAKVREVVGAGSSVMRCYYTSKLAKEPRKLPVYQWGLKGSIRCVVVLKQIAPYLIIKKKLALSIIKEVDQNPFGRWVNATPLDRELQGAITRGTWDNPDVRKKRLDGMARARGETSLERR